MTDDLARYLPAEQHPKLPAPDLQALVAEHGRYDLITPQAWERWDARMRRFQAAARARSKPK